MVKPSSTEVPLVRAKKLAQQLTTWFEHAQRKLPWREHPSPYSSWISEAMLQQTQVKTVLPYFERWMRRFPDLRSLADAEEQEVLSLWQGLGYYSRARRLRQTAQLVVHEHNGELPHSAAELRKLPGLGRYSAGAIASIVHGEAVAAVDGNVMRVLARLFGILGDPRKRLFQEQVWDIAMALVQGGNPGTINQGLMELGALICTPKRPNCVSCPWQKDCFARIQARIGEFPEPTSRPKIIQKREVILLIHHRGQWWLSQEPETASYWKKLYTFPHISISKAPEEAAQGLANQLLGITSHLTPLSVMKYSITQYRIEATAFSVVLTGKKRTQATGSWFNRQQIEDLPMPASHRRLFYKVSP